MKPLLKWAAFGLGVSLLLAVGWLPAVAPEMPRNWHFALPAGDAVAGEQSFARMKCHTCHVVPGTRFGEVEEGHGDVGPALTADYANLEREYVAESILAPDRIIAHRDYATSYVAEDGTSRMGDYSHVMTVRELVDIVEFLTRPGR